MRLFRQFLEVLREEGLDAVRYVLWDATGWHRDYSPPAWRNRATDEQKRRGWEMAVRIEKVLYTVLHRGSRAVGGGDDGDVLPGAGRILQELPG